MKQPLLFDLNQIETSYGDFLALKEMTCQVEAGCIGLLGPNGAGKSTLIKTLLGLLKPDRGRGFVLGHDILTNGLELRKEVGYMPENESYDPSMKAIDFVRYAGELCGMPTREAFARAHEVLAYVGLEEARYRPISGFSTGMKQRVKLAQALVHGPKLVFLDEPTNGLDSNGRTEMISLLQDIKAIGINLVVSTHILPDVERLCDHIMMMQRGELIYAGRIEDLYQADEKTISIKTLNKQDDFVKLLEKNNFTVYDATSKPRVVISHDDDPQKILSLAVSHDFILTHFVPTETTLEAAFLRRIDMTNSPN